MKVLLRNPRREIEVAGPRQVQRCSPKLELSRESHLVIRNGTLGAQATPSCSTMIVVEIRPVISGGA